MTRQPAPPDLKVVPLALKPRLRPSIGIAQLAETWGQPVKTIRSLIDKAELEAHYVGRGVSVFLDSAAAYQERHRRPPRPAKVLPRKTRKEPPAEPAQTPERMASLAWLAENDLI